MNPITLDLPWPPSANRYWRNFKGVTVVSKEARDYRDRIARQVSYLYKVKKDIRLAVDMLIYPPDKRKRDIDNLIKVTLDALAKGLGFDDCRVDKLFVERFEIIKGGLVKIKISEHKSIGEKNER